MGIKGLMKLISDHAPKAVKEQQMENYFVRWQQRAGARKVAIDASMSLYQFLIQIRSGPEGEVLTNDAGEATSHLQGLFYRTIRMLDSGLKPVFVFDGKPPELKGGELAKRTQKREDAEEGKKQAEADEDQEEINKYKKRLTKVTKEHNAEARELLRLMGVPIVEAPGEAEAQCSELVKGGAVYAVATEDMDALTFGTPRLLRHLTSPAARKEPVVEISLQEVLTGLNLNMDQFIDLCILCGCDYTVSIRGIGPHTALKLIQTHGSMAGALKHMDKDKYKVGDDFLPVEAAALFKAPDVTPASEVKLEWKDPDREGIIKFLVTEKGFSLERVEAALKRLVAARGKASQQRMEGFFKAAPAAAGGEVFHKPNASVKRKADEGKGSNKKQTGLAKKAKTAAAAGSAKKK